MIAKFVPAVVEPASVPAVPVKVAIVRVEFVPLVGVKSPIAGAVGEVESSRMDDEQLDVALLP